MFLTTIGTAVAATDLNVVLEPDWETRTRTRLGRPRLYTPIGVMVHHTALPIPYPVRKLYRSAQVNIKADGTVHVIAAGYQYASGFGMRTVLERARRNLPPAGDATKRGATNGNRWWVNIEVDHPGDRSPLPPVQHAALVTTVAAICDVTTWPPARVIGHREWTRRKPDPRWDGTANPMPQIRAAVAVALNEPFEEDDMYKTVKHRDGYGTRDGDPAVREWQELIGFEGDALDGKYGPATIRRVAALTGSDGTRIGPLEGAKILYAAVGPREAPALPPHKHRLNATTGLPVT